MNIYEKRTKEYDHCVKTVCDICGGDCKDKGFYDDQSVTITVTVRGMDCKRYPEGTFGEKFDPDICHDCFKDKVIPALRALGLKSEVDWKDIE